MVKTTRMGQTGIRAVLKSAMEPELRLALQEQLHAYDALEHRALSLAESRSWKVKDRDSPLRQMIEHMTFLKLGKKNRTTKIADMLIQGNTQGMIASLRDLHGYMGKDQEIRVLCQSLVDCEIENIRQMQSFL